MNCTPLPTLGDLKREVDMQLLLLDELVKQSTLTEADIWGAPKQALRFEIQEEDTIEQAISKRDHVRARRSMALRYLMTMDAHAAHQTIRHAVTELLHQTILEKIDHDTLTAQVDAAGADKEHNDVAINRYLSLCDRLGEAVATARVEKKAV